MYIEHILNILNAYIQVQRGSAAHRAGVHTQMYAKSIALCTGHNPPSFSAPVILGASTCRKRVTRPSVETTDDIIWRVGQPQLQDTHAVDMDALITSVDRILSTALLHNQEVQVEFLQYIG